MSGNNNKNKVTTSHHARFPICEVCEHAPASVTCKADAASLCSECDRDIHSANPLARRHERIPIVSKTSSEEEAEAASWILPDPSNNNNISRLFEEEANDQEKESLDFGIKEYKKTNKCEEEMYCTDGVVPAVVQYDGGVVVDGYPTTYDYGVFTGTNKPVLMYNFSNSQSSCCITQTAVSCSSVDIGVVPDHNAMTEVSKDEAILPTPLSKTDREAKVLRYREKRRNRKFEKTIRYASRKAYAETRPRIKGRFAKRSETESFIAADASYGVVPSF